MYFIFQLTEVKSNYSVLAQEGSSTNIKPKVRKIDRISPKLVRFQPAKKMCTSLQNLEKIRKKNNPDLQVSFNF